MYVLKAIDIPALLLLMGVATLYHRGTERFLQEGRVVHPRAVVFFWAGWAVTFVALISPLHEAAERHFWAHMMQHELLMVIAAPLLVLGRPVLFMSRSVPAGWLLSAKNSTRAGGFARIWKLGSTPVFVWLLHASAIWLWHVPVLFVAAQVHASVHALQHVSFFGSALLFWWVFIEQRRNYGLAVLALFTTALYTGLLGALLTFSKQIWYQYPSRMATASALRDQQLGGLIMWAPGGVAYIVTGLWLLARWLAESERAVKRNERYRFQHGPGGATS